MRKFLWFPVLALAVPLAMAADVYEIDSAHSAVGFKVKHLGISTVSGKFKAFKGTITLEGRDSTAAKVEADIDAGSIDTGVEMRDKHLRSPDFFDTAKYPDIRFVSAKVSEMKDDKFAMEGDLTMRGVTKSVKLDVVFGGSVKDPRGSERIAFTATGVLNRKDWNISWNKVLDSGGVMVSDQVKITLEIEAAKKAPEKK